ncbi:MAG: hypothetical protein M3461_07145 [Pseudomonadota bacterium]|nr:hypothetical protein [Pseudomonadota bacterium]
MLIEEYEGREGFVVIGSMGNGCDALPAPQRSKLTGAALFAASLWSALLG